MTERTTFSLDSEAYNFLQVAGGSNKSAYINELLLREKKRTLEEAVIKANKEEADDSDYQKELHVWDASLSDGVDS